MILEPCSLQAYWMSADRLTCSSEQSSSQGFMTSAFPYCMLVTGLGIGIHSVQWVQRVQWEQFLP